MAGITGQGTTYGLPNYTGELMSISPSETPFLSAIGGLSGGKSITSYEFEWQYYDLRASTASNTALEGAAAPTGVGRVRANATNLVEIHQSTINVSYTKQAAVGLKSGTNNTLTNPVTDEVAWQVEQELKAMAVDVEKSFLSGTYQKPTDNTTARQTRGILNAITTNVTDASTKIASGATLTDTGDTVTVNGHGLAAGTAIVLKSIVTTTGATAGTEYYLITPTTNTFQISATKGGAAVALTTNGTADVYTYPVLAKSNVDAMFQGIFDTGAADMEHMAILVGSRQKINLTKAYAENGTYFAPYAIPIPSNTEAGQSFSMITTDFGTFPVIVDRWMPVNTVAAINLGVCAPVFLEIPNKGHLFVEPLSKTGASDQFQIYGEVGLEYGNEKMHGQINNLA